MLKKGDVVITVDRLQVLLRLRQVNGLMLNLESEIVKRASGRIGIGSQRFSLTPRAEPCIAFYGSYPFHGNYLGDTNYKDGTGSDTDKGAHGKRTGQSRQLIG